MGCRRRRDGDLLSGGLRSRWQHRCDFTNSGRNSVSVIDTATNTVIGSPRAYTARPFKRPEPMKDDPVSVARTILIPTGVMHPTRRPAHLLSLVRLSRNSIRVRPISTTAAVKLNQPRPPATPDSGKATPVVSISGVRPFTIIVPISFHK
jgi:hypothetical protein